MSEKKRTCYDCINYENIPIDERQEEWIGRCKPGGTSRPEAWPLVGMVSPHGFRYLCPGAPACAEFIPDSECRTADALERLAAAVLRAMGGG